MHRHHVAVASLFALLLAGSAECAIITLNFEGFPDGTTLTTQYPGVTFTNTTVLKASFSLNEFEFPPRSGANVASDTGGPISISFATPATSFAGYFTYLMPLTLTAFNAANSPVGSITSKFANNLACLAGPPCSGNPGSSPNELLTINFAAGISKITIKGASNGGSFGVDDATITTSAVPEPAGIVLLISGLLVIRLRSRKS